MRMRGDVFAVIMAGGNGERLWPLSTAEKPKQFVDLFGGKPLICHAADRLKGLVPPERTFVVTAERFVAMTRRALPHVPRANIVGEPYQRNTAAAVAVACGLVKRHCGPDAVGCVLTADQLMTPERDFRQALQDAVCAASSSDAVVTIGIQPTYPATEFGYIKCGKVVTGGGRSVCCRVERFVEKPDEATARRYLKTERYLWNAGMFIWRASVMEAAFASAAPDVARLIPVVASAGNVARAMKSAYADVRSISVDYAVMEKIRNLLVVRGVFVWDDVGSWRSLVNHLPVDESGNVAIGSVVLEETGDSVVVSDEGHVTAVVGLRDVVVVRTPTATLVCAKRALSRMREVVRKAGGTVRSHGRA